MSSFLNFYLFFIGIQLLHNVVLVAGTQPNESDTPLFIFNISLRLLLCLHKLFVPVSQSAASKEDWERSFGRKKLRPPTYYYPAFVQCRTLSLSIPFPAWSQWIPVRMDSVDERGSVVYFHRGSGGELHMLTWLGYCSQLFNPTLILVLL